MKKFFTNSVLFVLFCMYMLCSCNKTDIQNQLQDSDQDDITMQDAARPGHHNPHSCVNPHHHHHHNPHCNCNCSCPDTVAMATTMSYSLDFLTDPQQVGVTVDVFYTNPGPQGTFRIVFSTNSGIDSVSVLPANHTVPGQEGVLNLQYRVPLTGSFPCMLQVIGRPANLQCDIRSSISFLIDNDVNRR